MTGKRTEGEVDDTSLPVDNVKRAWCGVMDSLRWVWSSGLVVDGAKSGRKLFSVVPGLVNVE